MSGRFLLDTNIVIALFADDAAVLQHLAEADEVFVPAIVLGEVYYGAQKSARVNENIAKIDEFARNTTVKDCDLGTARHYGVIKNTLRARGRPIPENDIWIAALASQHGLTLVTRDPHFEELPDLDQVAW